MQLTELATELNRIAAKNYWPQVQIDTLCRLGSSRLEKMLDSAKLCDGLDPTASWDAPVTLSQVDECAARLRLARADDQSEIRNYSLFAPARISETSLTASWRRDALPSYARRHGAISFTARVPTTGSGSVRALLRPSG